MSDSLKDILSHLSTEIDQETLLLYLRDELTEEKKHEVEKMLIDNEFAGDAMEGLQALGNKKELAGIIAQMNRDLKLKLDKKKKRREKLKLQEQPWLYITLVILLLLILISFVVIRRYLHQQ